MIDTTRPLSEVVDNLACIAAADTIGSLSTLAQLGATPVSEEIPKPLGSNNNTEFVRRLAHELRRPKERDEEVGVIGERLQIPTG
jgi:hypothetical protein